ncbi:MAG TPA: alpha-amylase family glycosyl hydrolase, partial [Blastocatellia bacterium]|nr:alpha-amylase family glycosyl hydrolase [Blastocatellia bacterium]
MNIGARYNNHGEVEFAVWAPLKKEVAVIIQPEDRIYEMKCDGQGYWRTTIGGLTEKTDYLYLLDREIKRPDPASNFQPYGVHGPSRIVDHSQFEWSDGMWEGVRLEEMVIYELHVGTFTQEGTFTAIIPRLNELKQLGINAIEIMPVAQFPGERNWGYDGVYSFAPQNSYGGPTGLKALVRACHKKGIAVILDV